MILHGTVQTDRTGTRISIVVVQSPKTGCCCLGRNSATTSGDSATTMANSATTSPQWQTQPPHWEIQSPQWEIRDRNGRFRYRFEIQLYTTMSSQLLPRWRSRTMISGGTEPVESFFLDTEPNSFLNNRLWTEPCTTNRKLEPNRTESNGYHTVIYG